MNGTSSRRAKLILVEGGHAPSGPQEPRDLDWAILMSHAQAGDLSAYRRLLREITPFVRSIVARRHRNPTDVEDAIQDVLMTVHTCRASYDPSRPFGPWLVAIADRRSVDQLRRRLRRKDFEATLISEIEVERTVHPAALEPFDSTELERAIEDLPEQQRLAIKLLKLDGLSLEEAAARTNTTSGALKAATHRAIRTLRARLMDRIKS